ncbi:MAG: hypothetical protein AAF705_16275, partial [Bacteroidota bacterium]
WCYNYGTSRINTKTMRTRRVNLNGVNYPIYYSNFVLAQFLEDYQVPMAELESFMGNITMLKAYKLAFYGVRAGCNQMKTPFSYEGKFEEFGEFIANDLEAFAKIMESFTHFFPSPEEEGKDDTKKKAKAKASS